MLFVIFNTVVAKVLKISVILHIYKCFKAKKSLFISNYTTFFAFLFDL